MARRRRRREERKPLTTPQLAALFGVGIMIVSSLAYAILHKPPVGSRKGAQAVETPAPQNLFTSPAPQQQPAGADSDGDGLPDELEAQIGTDPLVKDTPASLEERRSRIYREYTSGRLSLEEYAALSKKLDEAERLLR